MQPSLQIMTVDGVTQLWVQVDDIDPQWRAAYRLVLQDGVPVIGEVRVLPQQGSRGPYWTAGDKKGPIATVPRGGVRAKLLRSLTIPAVGQFGQRMVARMPGKLLEYLREGKQGQSLARLAGLAAPDGTGEERSLRGRKGRGDPFYARVAQTYAAEIGKGTRRGILEVVRKQHRLSTVSHARAAVHRARALKFLGGGQQGRASGVLTDKAKAVLKRSGTPKTATTRQRAAKKKRRVTP